MKVVWKRPDGYHGASPDDYAVVELSAATKLWLHKKDRENFPFRVSGGWQDEAASRKLNRMINLLTGNSADWIAFLSEVFDNERTENTELFLSHQLEWLDTLDKNLKGDNWEVEIMHVTIAELRKRINEISQQFVAERKKD